MTNAATQLSDLGSKVSRIETQSSQVDPHRIVADVAAMHEKSINAKAPNLPDELLPHSSSLPLVTSAPLPQSPSSPMPTQLNLDTAKQVPAPKPPILGLNRNQT